MSWLAVALALQQPAPTAPVPPSWYGGRIYTSQGLHVGVRPAFDCSSEGDWAIGLTVQVTVRGL